MLITIEQIKAARALLKWTQKDLAQQARLQDDQVHSFEAGRTRSLDVLEAIYKTFILQGLDFIDDGVVRRKHEIQTLEGQQGFWDFYDDVYETVKHHGGDILVHNVEKDIFTLWLGEKRWPHWERMRELSFAQKVILQEGDSDFSGAYTGTEHRWAAHHEFGLTPCFYIYGPKMAIINFEKDHVTIFKINHPKITKSFRVLFMEAWERAKIPPTLKPPAERSKRSK